MTARRPSKLVSSCESLTITFNFTPRRSTDNNSTIANSLKEMQPGPYQDYSYARNPNLQRRNQFSLVSHTKQNLRVRLSGGC